MRWVVGSTAVLLFLQASACSKKQTFTKLNFKCLFLGKNAYNIQAKPKKILRMRQEPRPNDGQTALITFLYPKAQECIN